MRLRRFAYASAFGHSLLCLYADARPAEACECRAPRTRVVPALQDEGGKPYRAPLNSHIWILTNSAHTDPYAKWFGPVVRDAENRDVTYEVSTEHGAFFHATGADYFSIAIELVPKHLTPGRRYRVYLVPPQDGRATPDGEFEVGANLDTLDPVWDAQPVLELHDGMVSSCHYGDPWANVGFSAARDDTTPPGMMLYRVSVASRLPGSAASSDNLLLAAPGRGPVDWHLGLHADNSLCASKNLSFPFPRTPARLTITPLDLAGRSAAPAEMLFDAPHTAESRALAVHLDRQAALAAPTDSPSRPPGRALAPDSRSVRSLSWLWAGLAGGVAGLALGIAIGKGRFPRDG